ncbi:MAG: JAB domain-containing protein [Christensenellales bacterium]|jgi:DNA repair protein RadC
MEKLHAGHRERLRKRARDEGIESFAPHEVLELLLFYTRPRGDMNPVAHEALRRFGTLAGALHAQKDELAQCRGIGLATARFLECVASAADAYAASRLTDRAKITDMASFRLYCLGMFLASPQNEARLLCMGSAGHLLSAASVDIERKSVRHFVRDALLCHAQAVAIADYRREGDMAFTDEDIRFLNALCGVFVDAQLQLVDWVLMGQGKMVSARKAGVFEHLCPDTLRSAVFLRWLG